MINDKRNTDGRKIAKGGRPIIPVSKKLGVYTVRRTGSDGKKVSIRSLS